MEVSVVVGVLCVHGGIRVPIKVGVGVGVHPIKVGVGVGVGAWVETGSYHPRSLKSTVVGAG